MISSTLPKVAMRSQYLFAGCVYRLRIAIESSRFRAAENTHDNRVHDVYAVRLRPDLPA
jgi:hypothetical protein